MVDFVLLILEVMFNTLIVLSFIFGIEAIYYQMGARNGLFLSLHHLLFEKDRLYTYDSGFWQRLSIIFSIPLVFSIYFKYFS